MLVAKDLEEGGEVGVEREKEIRLMMPVDLTDWIS